MKLQQYIDIGQSPDLPTFHSRLRAFAGGLDFNLFNATLVVDRPGEESSFIPLANNIPREFVEAQDVALSKRDPILRHLKCQSTPCVYDQDFYVSAGAADLWDIQAAHGYITGVAVVLHLPRRQHFLLGIDRDGPLPKRDEHVAALLATLQLLAVHAQDVAVRLHDKHAVAKPGATLTAREKEVLAWTMEGKSAWAVSRILSISEHTVNFHVRNAQRKLGTSSKHQSVLRALALGIF